LYKALDFAGSILVIKCRECHSPIFFSWHEREKLCCSNCGQLFKVTKNVRTVTIVHVLSSVVTCGCGRTFEISPTNSYFNCPGCGREYYNAKNRLAKKIIKRKAMMEAIVNAKGKG